eukprot:sb/3477358/
MCIYSTRLIQSTVNLKVHPSNCLTQLLGVCRTVADHEILKGGLFEKKRVDLVPGECSITGVRAWDKTNKFFDIRTCLFCVVHDLYYFVCRLNLVYRVAQIKTRGLTVV